MYVGTKSDSQVQESDWSCDVCDRILLSKAGCINHMKPYDTLPLRLGDTTYVTRSKVCKSFFSLKRHHAVHKNFLPESNQITSSVITPIVCHLCLQVCEDAAVAIDGWKSHLRVHRRRRSINPEGTGKSRDSNHFWSWSYMFMCVRVCARVTLRSRARVCK